jgi:hypothetical protein
VGQSAQGGNVVLWRGEEEGRAAWEGGGVLWCGEAGEGERPPKSSSAHRRPAKAIPLSARSMAVRHGVARHGRER